MNPEPRLSKSEVLFMGGLALRRAHPNPYHLDFLTCLSAMSYLVDLTPYGLDLGFSFNPLTETKSSD